MSVKFSSCNSKLNELASHMGYSKKSVVSFDLSAGWSCPCADICKTKADPETGKLERFGKVLCYAAKLEAIFPASRRLHTANFEALKACGTDVLSMAKLIMDALPKQTKIVRIHSSGDFFNASYFQAWVMVAENNPGISFFGYTKNINFVIADKPDNFRLVYSYGSLHDKKWGKMDCRPATAFIEVTPGQYPDVKQVCGSHETSFQDFFAVMSGETFKLAVH